MREVILLSYIHALSAQFLLRACTVNLPHLLSHHQLETKMLLQQQALFVQMWQVLFR